MKRNELKKRIMEELYLDQPSDKERERVAEDILRLVYKSGIYHKDLLKEE